MNRQVTESYRNMKSILNETCLPLLTLQYSLFLYIITCILLYYLKLPWYNVILRVCEMCQQTTEWPE